MTLTPPFSRPFTRSQAHTHATARPALNFSASGSISGSFKVSSPSAKNYVSNGYAMNNNGYLAHPTHAAQVAANNAGALTRSEAARMGLSLGGR